MERKKTKSIQKAAIILLFASLGLTACANKTDTKNETKQADSAAETQVVQEAPTDTTDTKETSSNEDKVQAVLDQIKQCESLDQTYHNEMETNASMTQNQMNQTAEELYNLWDDCLNAVWDVIKLEKSDSEFSKIKEEQLAWIEDKENQIKEAGEAYQGGSMQSMVESLKGAELTKKRVYELADYLEE